MKPIWVKKTGATGTIQIDPQIAKKGFDIISSKLADSEMAEQSFWTIPTAQELTRAQVDGDFDPGQTPQALLIESREPQLTEKLEGGLQIMQVLNRQQGKHNAAIIPKPGGTTDQWLVIVNQDGFDRMQSHMAQTKTAATAIGKG